MLSCRKTLQQQSMLMFILLLVIAYNHKSLALPVAEAEPESEATAAGDPQLVVITEDVIPDIVEMDQKKVIRVNPLDLPPIKEDPNKMNADSSLYKIQTLNPYQGKRKYVNSQSMRKTTRPPKEDMPAKGEESLIIRALPAVAQDQKFVKPKHQPKKKHLHFLYNQEDLSGNLVAKTMRVHTAPGAYPVFYAVAKTNGRFGKYPLKSFSTPREFKKYLHKRKLENIANLEMTYE